MLLGAIGAALVLAVVVIVLVMRGSSEPEKPKPPTEPIAAQQIDAAVAVAPDAAAPVPPARPATIADAVASADWERALTMCTNVSSVAPTNRKLCGLAACNQRDRTKALAFHKLLASADKRGLEAACRDVGVQLVVQPKIDRCKDPEYLEKNPMKCL